MIYHIFKLEKFTNSFIVEINRKLNQKKNIFLVYKNQNDTIKYELLEYSNVIYLNDETDAINYIRKYFNYNIDKLIMHSLFLSKRSLLFFFLNKKIISVSSWVLWGGDLYNFLDKKYSVNELLRKRIIYNLENIITYVKGDYILCRNKYKTKAKYLSGFYPYLLDKKVIRLCVDKDENKYKDKAFKYILLGNSADPSNNHIEALNKLKNIKRDNFKIIVPLSYGDREYTKKVIKYGREVFGERFVALEEFVNFKDYIEMLNKIDVAIFNHRRQQAMGNIITLLYLGKKVYLRRDITSWEFFCNSDIKVYDFLNPYSIDTIFMNEDEEELYKNREKLDNRFSVEKFYTEWEQVLSY